jgi:SPP1 gp7 family putative phage head morphogenesis protein
VRNAEYWKIRFGELEEASNRYGLDTYAQIEPTFDSAQRKIQKEIEAWYGRYARNNGITMQEARKQLSAAELKEFRWDVNEYIKRGRENALNQQWMKELENASARVHVSRLEALKIRTQQAAELAFGNELDCIDAMARKVFTEDYYHSIFEIQKGFGIGWEIGQIDQKKLDKFIKKPWALDGKHFSERIWQQRGQLVSEIHQQLTRTCILGKAPDDAIKAISKKFGTTKSNAGRLVMTEQAYFHSVAQKEAFNDLDVEEFEIVATLDSETSEICQEMDGKHFPMSTYEAGVTAPPFHPCCRSVPVPYFEDNFTGERAARNADGETYYVPDNMTYKEWKKGMVEGDTEDLTIVASNGKIDAYNSVFAPNVTINGKKQGSSFDISDALKGTNPNYSLGGQYKVNCQRCVQAYEFRRRGFDVEALPKPKIGNTIDWGNECFVNANGVKPPFRLHQSENSVKNELANAPDGARYIIYTAWKSHSAHVFIAEKENGIIKYVDPQTGDADVKDYFSNGRHGMFGFLRIDDKDLTSDMSIINATMR